MSNRNSCLAVALFAGLAPLCSHADPVVATLAAVQGTVLVSRAEGLVAGAAGQPLGGGARVVATSQSRAVLRYQSGCEVVVPENSRATVQPEGSCAKLKLAVVALPAIGAIGGSAGASVPAVSGVTLGAAAGAVGVGYGGYKALVRERRSSSTSAQ